MASIDGKVAIVTGGGSGIGKAICERFVREGATVVIAEVDRSSGTATAHSLQDANGKALFVQTDVSQEDSVQNMVHEVIRTYDRIDILVNNAALFVFKGIDATPEDWEQVLRVNVIGTALVSKHVIREMKRTGGGAIVNLASISSFIAQPEFVTYNASKAAIASMTRCMALDLAPDHIRVNAVCPGTVWTPIVEKLTQEQGLSRTEADAHPDWGGKHILNRLADPHEVASAVLFLASDEASFITGEHLMVDGGYTAR